MLFSAFGAIGERGRGGTELEGGREEEEEGLGGAAEGSADWEEEEGWVGGVGGCVARSGIGVGAVEEECLGDLGEGTGTTSAEEPISTFGEGVGWEGREEGDGGEETGWEGGACCEGEGEPEGGL